MPSIAGTESSRRKAHQIRNGISTLPTASATRTGGASATATRGGAAGFSDTARVEPSVRADDHREERIARARDQRRDEPDPPEPGRVGAAERAEEVGAEPPARAAAEFGEDGAEHRVGRRDAEAARIAGRPARSRTSAAPRPRPPP